MEDKLISKFKNTYQRRQQLRSQFTRPNNKTRIEVQVEGPLWIKFHYGISELRSFMEFFVD